ncbi:hypothetical protein SAICODRAFT_28404 [Saitoella complicata NRRL Y-17804]|uniref:uncharacterized protein n=1 Tax=Saitoella complicata (strain BCRC 22490 / CBS 7301 / JCM 7358 / NBRC 10748 / NRRL Y-17804) TaxID=698492 RepID=UPI00086739D5|nr:uncharacterized protein SAICODRAFT_28404 [Saitoella complicata NRRL Y-17804]ODQ56151.1 hypothetical protein SAICODRAFT_28404 [Saitoella complicata NRRL Y-17804]
MASCNPAIDANAPSANPSSISNHALALTHLYLYSITTPPPSLQTPSNPPPLPPTNTTCSTTLSPPSSSTETKG